MQVTERAAQILCRNTRCLWLEFACPPLHPWLKHLKPTQQTVGDADEAVIHFAGHIQSALQGSHLSGCRGTPWKWDIATLATAAKMVLKKRCLHFIHAIVDRHFPLQIVQMMFPSPIFGTNSCYKPKINPSECPLVTSKPGIFSSSTALRANSSSARFCRHLAGHSPAICGVRGNPSGIFHPVGHATFRHSKSTSERGMEQECCCYRPSSWWL